MGKLTKLISFGLVIIMLLLGVVIYNQMQESEDEPLGYGIPHGTPVDVIGTKSGTSTTGVHFTAHNASTTYPTHIGTDASMATYTFKATDASSTGSSIAFYVLGSMDEGCDSATTSADVGNPVLMDDINWFDATPNIVNIDGSATTMTAGTSTVAWSPTYAGAGDVLNLNNLNYRCLALRLSGTSTDLWVQLTAK